MQKFSLQIPVSGGVNRDADPRAVSENQMVSQRNAYPNLSGILQKRPGCRPYAPTADNDALFAFVPDKATGAEMVTVSYLPSGVIIAAQPSVLSPSAVFSEDQLVDAGTPTWFNWRGFTFICFGYPIEGFFAVTSQTGVLTVSRVSFEYSGSGVTAQSQAIPVCPAVGTSYRGAAVWANFGPGRENQILIADRVSATHAPAGGVVQPLAAVIGTDALSLNGRYITIDHLRGDSIIGLREVMLGDLSNQLQTGLLIWGRQRAVLATGITLQTTDIPTPPQTLLGDFIPNAMNRNAGLVGPSAHAATPLGLFWVSADNVWLMRGGASPTPVGDAIRSEVRKVPSQFQHRVHVLFHQDRLVVGLPTSEELSVPPNTPAVPRIAYWWLDLRDDLQTPPRWYGPMEYRTDGQSFVIDSPDAETLSPGGVIWACSDDNDPGGPVIGLNSETFSGLREARLVDLVPQAASGPAMDLAGLYVYDSNLTLTAETQFPQWRPSTEYSEGQVVRPLANNGRTYRCSTAGTSSAVEPVWTTFPPVMNDNTVVWELIEAFLPMHLIAESAAVQMEPVTRVMDFGATGRRSALKRLEVEAQVSEPQKLLCTDSMDMGNTNKVMSILAGRGTNADLATGLPMTLGSDSLHRSFFPGEQVIIASQHQLRFSDDTAFIVDSTNDVLVFSVACRESVLEVGQLQSYVTVSVAHGVYEDTSALAAAINTALSSAVTLLNATGLLTFSSNPGLVLSTPEQLWAWKPQFSLASSVGFDIIFPVIMLGEWDIFAVNPGGITATQLSTPGMASDTAKCRRLLALLGFDMDERVPAQTSAPAWTPASGSLEGAPLLWPSEGSGTGVDVVFWAAQSAYSLRPVRVELAGAEVSGIIQGGKPFNTRDR